MTFAATGESNARSLADGNSIPLLGLGVWQVANVPECVNAVRWALELGYRHFDTAQAFCADSGALRTSVVMTSSFGSDRERRGRDPRRAANAVEDECNLVDVAPAPVLAWLDRADDRVRRRMIVRGCVAVRGVVAAADVTTGEADAEVQPLAALEQAVLAAVDGHREVAKRDLVEVGAELAHRTRAVERARCWWTN
jgi:hypothetical protein